MKTIREWLMTIEDETIRTQAIRNAERDVPITLDNLSNDLSHAISSAFSWDEYEQTFDYWSEIYSQALNGTLKTREI